MGDASVGGVVPPPNRTIVGSVVGCGLGPSVGGEVPPPKRKIVGPAVTVGSEWMVGCEDKRGAAWIAPSMDEDDGETVGLFIALGIFVCLVALEERSGVALGAATDGPTLSFVELLAGEAVKSTVLLPVAVSVGRSVVTVEINAGERVDVLEMGNVVEPGGPSIETTDEGAIVGLPPVPIKESVEDGAGVFAATIDGNAAGPSELGIADAGGGTEAGFSTLIGDELFNVSTGEGDTVGIVASVAVGKIVKDGTIVFLLKLCKGDLVGVIPAISCAGVLVEIVSGARVLLNTGTVVEFAGKSLQDAGGFTARSQMPSSINLLKPLILAYTAAGTSSRPQPNPKLTKPTCIPWAVRRGPPLSPWQLSRPLPAPPAHSMMSFTMRPKKLLQVSKSTTFTWTF